MAYPVFLYSMAKVGKYSIAENTKYTVFPVKILSILLNRQVYQYNTTSLKKEIPLALVKPTCLVRVNFVNKTLQIHFILQRSDYEELCSSKECAEKIISKAENTLAKPVDVVSAVASKSGHLSSSSVNTIFIYNIMILLSHSDNDNQYIRYQVIQSTIFLSRFFVISSAFILTRRKN